MENSLNSIVWARGRSDFWKFYKIPTFKDLANLFIA